MMRLEMPFPEDINRSVADIVQRAETDPELRKELEQFIATVKELSTLAKLFEDGLTRASPTSFGVLHPQHTDGM